MKALTVRQPWAHLIMHAGKDIENRKWPTQLRGRVAIHSSARIDKREIEDACNAMRNLVKAAKHLEIAAQIKKEHGLL